MDPIVGIDLGTTNSLCAIFENGHPRLLPNAHGEVLTPSVVGILDDGQVLIGAAARELRVTRPDRCASCFKRYMGTDQALSLGDRSFTASELSSMVLQSLKMDASAALGVEIKRAVITVPAYFNDNQRKATKLAGEMAGLDVCRIINEPTAAALTYGFHDREAEKHILVIDLGGGTFDVTLMEIFEGTLEIISTAGESFLGGEDFTNRMVAGVLNEQGLQLESAELQRPLLVARLRQECEVAKRKLLEASDALIRIPNDQGEIAEDAKVITVTRDSFKELVDPLMQRLARPIGKALRDGECPPDQVADVILVGGATRMPVLRDFIARYLRREPHMEFNPDEVVALGAAVQAALIADDRAVEDMVMTDVCPFTLGVEVVKEFGARQMGGYFQPVIHRNTTIPVSREEILHTLHANQMGVTVRVFQGEGRRVKDNLELGELQVDGIPPGPAGTPVHVRFTYDLNGILEVEAFVPQTGKKFRAVLTNHVKNLSRREVESALKKLQALKFYPRDELQNQRLLLYCERIVGEVSPFHRDQLEQAVDVFEIALSSGDREMFTVARDGLLMMLSQLGFSYEEGDPSGDQETD